MTCAPKQSFDLFARTGRKQCISNRSFHLTHVRHTNESNLLRDWSSVLLRTSDLPLKDQIT